MSKLVLKALVKKKSFFLNVTSKDKSNNFNQVN